MSEDINSNDRVTICIDDDDDLFKIIAKVNNALAKSGFPFQFDEQARPDSPFVVLALMPRPAAPAPARSTDAPDERRMDATSPTSHTAATPSTCPQCIGETDPFQTLLTTLCAKHLAEAETNVPSDREIDEAMAQGARDYEAVMTNTPGLPGYFRGPSSPSPTSERSVCHTCGAPLDHVSYDRTLMRCPKCTSRSAPAPFVASLIERTDDSLLCVWSAQFNGWVLPGGLMDSTDTTIEDTHTRTLQDLFSCRVTDRTLIYESTSDLGRYFFVFRTHVFGALTASHMSNSKPPAFDKAGEPKTWLTRAELLRVSPLASLYRNLFAHVPSPTLAPSYDAALDAAERWLAPRGPNPADAASLAALLRYHAEHHAAFMTETHRLELIVKLERIGALQRQCHQLEQALRNVSASDGLREIVRRLDDPRTHGALLELVRRLDSVSQRTLAERADEREAILHLIASTADQYQIDGWQQLADACRLLANRIKNAAHTPGQSHDAP